MWHTSIGDRTLSGAEAQLVIETCGQIIDSLDMEVRDRDGMCYWETGVELFDSQSVHQRIALVDQVCRHLLTEGESVLELNAELEATVMAIYESVKSQIEIEIDELRCFGEPSCECRSMVLAAYDYVCPQSDEVQLEPEDEVDDLPDLWCDEIDQWDWVIELLADRVLWDRDFEMASMIVDEDPEMAEAYKQVLGIEHDYFSNAPPEVDEDDAVNVLNDLRRFLGFSSTRRKPR